MKVKEFYVQDRRAIAVTSMVGMGDTIYLGLTGGSYSLAKFHIPTETMSLCCETFPHLGEKQYCTKIHNSMGKLDDRYLVIGEGNHFSWDGLPVYSAYLKKELPEIMLQRKREQGYPDITYSDFCLERLDDWDRTRDDKGGKIMIYDTHTDTVAEVCDMPQFCYSQAMTVDPKRGFAYGNTIPDNHFFSVDVKNNKLTDFGRISEYGHHNMAVAPNGMCYGGWVDYYNHCLRLLKFDPNENRLYHTDKLILKDIGAKIAGNQGIDQWLVTKDGEMYMGAVANSLIFRFDWENEEFDLVGQAGTGGRVSTMDEDDNGIIWLGAGHPTMHLVRFDKNATGKDRFIDYGEVNNSNYRCYFHASYYYKNKLYLGETDGFTPSLHVIDLEDL